MWQYFFKKSSSFDCNKNINKVVSMFNKDDTQSLLMLSNIDHQTQLE